MNNLIFKEFSFTQDTLTFSLSTQSISVHLIWLMVRNVRRHVMLEGPFSLHLPSDTFSLT